MLVITGINCFSDGFPIGENESILQVLECSTH